MQVACILFNRVIPTNFMVSIKSHLRPRFIHSSRDLSYFPSGKMVLYRSFFLSLFLNRATDSRVHGDKVYIVALFSFETGMPSYKTSEAFKSDKNASDFVENNGVSSNEQGCSNDKNIESSEFGNFQDTRDWIECESITFPGKIYFFNLRTLCSTWIRPVSRNVRLQHFPRKSSIYDNSFTCESNPSMIVSSEDEDNEFIDNEVIKKKRDDERNSKNSEILTRLYYGTDVKNSFDDNESSYSNGCVCNFSEDSYSKKNTCFTLPNSSCHKLGEHFLSALERDEDCESSVAVSDLVEVKFHSSKNVSEIAEKNGNSSHQDDVSTIAEKPIVYSSSNEGEIDCDYHSVPRLSKIKPKYLLKEKPQKMRGRKKSTKQVPLVTKKVIKTKPTKIVCEMYGTKTINYDPIERQLPPNVKVSNLSDTSVNSSMRETRSVKPIDWNNFKVPGVKSCVDNLSSESNSNLCSALCSSVRSSCTCCSTSCGTSTSSSSTTNTSKREKNN